MPIVIMTIVRVIGGTLLSMLTSVIFSPVYIKKVAMLGLDKLKSMLHGRNMTTAEKAVDEAEEVLRKDPDLTGK